VKHDAANDAEAVELSNWVRIQVNSASYTRTRGFAIAVAILDEIAFWPTDTGSANPDHEILNAIRPRQAQFGDHAVHEFRHSLGRSRSIARSTSACEIVGFMAHAEALGSTKA
jgi:hypothetical protein